MYAKGSSSSQTAQNTSHDVPNAFCTELIGRRERLYMAASQSAKV